MLALRSYAFTLFMAMLTAVMGLALAPLLLFGTRAAQWSVRRWARIVLFALRVICGVDMKIKGAEHIPDGPAIVAANHQSMWETVSLMALLPRPVIVFKKELLRIPVYGWWAWAAGLAIDRDAGVKSMRSLKRDAALRMQARNQIVIFPEGTRGAPGGLSPLLPGVAGVYLAAEAPVTPAVHNYGEHWRHPGSLKTPGTITLEFLPPIPPGLPRREFMAALEQALLSGDRGIPVPESQP